MGFSASQCIRAACGPDTEAKGHAYILKARIPLGVHRSVGKDLRQHTIPNDVDHPARGKSVRLEAVR